MLYAGEGEVRKADEQLNALEVSSIRGEDKPGALMHKGHEFLLISYHMPTTCEVCPKPLWNMFRPPPALECRSKSFVIVLCIFILSAIPYLTKYKIQKICTYLLYQGNVIILL